MAAAAASSRPPLASLPGCSPPAPAAVETGRSVESAGYHLSARLSGSSYVSLGLHELWFPESEGKKKKRLVSSNTFPMNASYACFITA